MPDSWKRSAIGIKLVEEFNDTKNENEDLDM